MKSYWFILSGICVAGCMASNGLQYQAVSETNVYHIAKIRKGMSEKQVLQIMHRPYSYETFQAGEDIYDVWFYVTRATGLDQTRMVAQNLTPLTFKNGVLVGTGYNWYYYAMKEQAAEVADQNPQPEKTKSQEDEDVEFENALKTFPEKSVPPKLNAPTTPPKTSANPQTLPSQMSMAPPICQPEKKLSDLAKGMTETQVFTLMGEPMKNQTFEMGGDVYDVWFYETFPNKTGKPSLIPQNVTPLTFKNAFLVSMSEDGYFDLKEEVDRQTASLTPVEETPAVELSQPATPADPEVSVTKKPFSILKPWKAPLAATAKKTSKIQMGMTETEVTNILGSPSNYETFLLDNDVYDVWFYEMPSTKKNQVTKKMPLTFKNTVLVGMTLDYYNGIREATKQDKIDCYDRAADRMQEDESEQNFNFW